MAASALINSSNGYRIKLLFTSIEIMNIRNISLGFSKCFMKYIQGQKPLDNPKTREYFYYIDHQGMLFLDDTRIKNFTSCFKDKTFLHFFFTRIKLNDSGKYENEFPYLSPCGREKNYVRCDDLPIVFTHIIEGPTEEYLSYAHAGDLLKVEFQPHKLCMFPQSGRVYHPSTKTVGGVGLVKSTLAIELSKNFDFTLNENSMPTHFTWKATKYVLTNEILELVNEYSLLKR